MFFPPQQRALFRHLNVKKWSYHFDLETCFAPQRRWLFRHLNFQKLSEPGVFCTFWLANVLPATTACTFSTSQLPKVVRTWGVVTFFTYKCASHHNGVQFFISHLTSWLRTRRFSEVTFRPSGAPNHWKKHSESRPSYLFAHLHLLSSDFLPLWSSPSLIFSSLTLPTSAFPSLHIVGSLTSKLPDIQRSFCLNLFEYNVANQTRSEVGYWTNSTRSVLDSLDMFYNWLHKE